MVLIGGWGIRMTARTARWVAGCAAAGSVALTGGGLVLAYVDRHLVPASLTGWTVSNVSGQAAVVVRFAKSSGEERLQLKWCAAAALVLAVEFVASVWVNSAVINVLAEPGVLVPVDVHRDRGPQVPAV
jgi:hypothetical protein